MCCTRKLAFTVFWLWAIVLFLRKMAAAIVLFPRKLLRKCGAFGKFRDKNLIDILIEI